MRFKHASWIDLANRGDLDEELPAKVDALCGQSPPLIVGQAKALLSELAPQDPFLFLQELEESVLRVGDLSSKDGERGTYGAHRHRTPPLNAGTVKNLGSAELHHPATVLPRGEEAEVGRHHRRVPEAHARPETNPPSTRST